MKVLDLYCGCGGATKGLQNAGFEVTGIDNKPMPYYCGNEFIQCDINEITTEFIRSFDLVWASPPCQLFSVGTLGVKDRETKYPNLIEKTRKLLLNSHVPFIIENVPNAPLRKDLMLCGEMFDLRVIRHRIFEIEGFKVEQPKHLKHKRSVCKGEAIGVWNGGKPGGFGKRSYYMQVAGHGGNSYSFKLEDWQKAMGINWIHKKKYLTQCVPPAYSEYIGNFFANL